MKSKFKANADEIWREYSDGVDYNESIGLYETVRKNENFFIGNQWEGVNAPDLEKPVLNVTGASFYQIFVDGELINYGPARKASGYAAVDIVELPCNIENTEIVIRSIGYNCRSFNCVDSVPYIQAELYDGEKILAATGRYGFRYYAVPSYLQKVV